MADAVEKRHATGSAAMTPASARRDGRPVADRIVGIQHDRVILDQSGALGAAAEGRVGRDERFRRTWRLYLAGSEAAFRTGSLQLFQVLFAPGGPGAAPWTRRGLYAEGPGLSWNVPTS